MQGMIDKLWQIHNECVPDYQGKIWINQTGGLDSRILGAIISQRRQIDFGFYYYYAESEHNVEHVIKIVNLLDYKDFKFIKLSRSGYGGFDDAIHGFNQPVNSKEYTYIVNSYGDAVSGRFRTKRRERRFYCELQKETNLPKTEFKSIKMPLWNPRFVGYMYSMPRYQRLNQHAYRMMIKKYLPELYEIPRCFEEGYRPVKMNKFYMPNVIWEKLR